MLKSQAQSAHWQNCGAMECLRVCRLVRLVRVCGRTRERGEREREEKEQEQGWSSCSDHKVSVTRSQLASQTHFLLKNENRKRTKAPQTSRKHIKRLFDFGFIHWLVWFFVLGGWALGSKPWRLTHNQLCVAYTNYENNFLVSCLFDLWLIMNPPLGVEVPQME